MKVPAAVARRIGLAIECRDVGMNKTEAAYAEHLMARQLAGEIVDFDPRRDFEAITLRMAKKTAYTPDFLVQLANGELELHEVKGRPGSGPGGWRDDARAKIKLATVTHPKFRYVGAAKLPPGKGGGWKIEVFN